jgi:hypothetical protein
MSGPARECSLALERLRLRVPASDECLVPTCIDAIALKPEESNSLCRFSEWRSEVGIVVDASGLKCGSLL